MGASYDINTIFIDYASPTTAAINPNSGGYDVSCDSLNSAYNFPDCHFSKKWNWNGNLMLGNTYNINSSDNIECASAMMLDGVFNCSVNARYIFIELESFTAA